MSLLSVMPYSSYLSLTTKDTKITKKITDVLFQFFVSLVLFVVKDPCPLSYSFQRAKGKCAAAFVGMEWSPADG